MSNLSELLPAGAGAKSADFVASGTLASGQTVILKSNGQVEAVSATGGGQATGTPVVFENANINNLSSVFDSSNNKIVIGYRDLGNSSYGTAVVGTVSGTSISFGSPVVFNTGNSASVSATFDSSANKVVISWSDVANGFYGTSIVGTVSGTSISFGTAVIFKSAFVLPYSPSSTFDSNSNKVVIAYRNLTSIGGEAVVGTVSGTSISFGTPVVYNANSVNYVAATFDSNSNKVVIGYADVGNSYYGTAIVGTVSGTSISFGTAVVFNAAEVSQQLASAFDSNSNKVIFMYADLGNSYYGTAIVGTVSGTSISFGSESVFVNHAGNADLQIAAAFDTTSNKVLITYLNYLNSGYATAVLGTVSGTSISFGTPLVYEQSTVSYQTAVFDSVANNVVISYNKAVGTSSVYTVAGSNSADFIGITDEAISSAASGSVIVQGGVITNTGLIPASASVGSTTAFSSTTAAYSSSTFDSSNNKIVVSYSDNNGYGTGVVGTVSGNTVSYGTPVVFSTNFSYYTSIVYDSANNRVVIAYQDSSNSSYGTAIVGTVSGTSISFGTAVVFNAATTDNIGIGFDSNANKVVIAYKDGGNSNYGTSIIGTVSGTSISFGTEVVYQSSNSEFNTVTFDSSNNKIVVAYTCAATNGTASVGTVSATSISFGTAVAFNPTRGSNYLSGAFDSNSNKVVLYYADSPTAAIGGMCVVGTVSGTSISFGTAVAVGTSTSSSFTALSFDSSVNKIMMAYRGYFSGTYLGRLAVGTVSGTSITIANAITFNAANSYYISLAFDSNANKSVLSYSSAGSSFGDGAVISFSSDLTIGTDYFVQTDGTISTTSSTVPAGRALSTTSILLEG